MGIFSKFAQDPSPNIEPKHEVIKLPKGRTIYLSYGLKAIIIERDKLNSVDDNSISE